MKVLWFTQTPGGASKYLNSPTIGGGWIVSLGDIMKERDGVELAVCFFNNHIDKFKFEFEGITYYPIKDRFATRTGYVKSKMTGQLPDTNLAAIFKAIKDYKPDIIHIFGTESGLGDIAGKTTIPVIIHIQGLLNPYVASWLPRGISLRNIFFKSRFKELVLRRDLLSGLSELKKKARREDHIIKNTRYFFGRTAWDERVVRLFNPKIEYFHCDEVLRPFIYEHSGKWNHNNASVVRLVTTINAQIYKGLEIVLQTAELMKTQSPLKFEWIIIGVSSMNRIVRIAEINSNVRFKDLPITFQGPLHGEALVSELLSSHLFIHPSHIDNSPNSVCEAMILGMPVIAGYVGGIPSLIEHNHNGILYNSYDRYDLASIIIKYAEDLSKLERLGANAFITAKERHDPDTIVEMIENTYRQLLPKPIQTNHKW